MATHGEIRRPPVGSFGGRLWGGSHGRRQRWPTTRGLPATPPRALLRRAAIDRIEPDHAEASMHAKFACFVQDGHQPTDLPARIARLLRAAAVGEQNPVAMVDRPPAAPSMRSWIRFLQPVEVKRCVTCVSTSGPDRAEQSSRRPIRTPESAPTCVASAPRR